MLPGCHDQIPSLCGFPDHSLHSNEGFTKLKILTLCLQKGRSCLRSLWHFTLNTSNSTLTKLVSNLKCFANTLYFHNFISYSLCASISTKTPHGVLQSQVICNQEKQVQCLKQEVKSRQKSQLEHLNPWPSLFPFLLPPLSPVVIHSMHAESGFPLIPTASHI